MDEDEAEWKVEEPVNQEHGEGGSSLEAEGFDDALCESGPLVCGLFCENDGPDQDAGILDALNWGENVKDGVSEYTEQGDGARKNYQTDVITDLSVLLSYGDVPFTNLLADEATCCL